MKTSCSEARNELPLFVGGDLEPETQERVARHLEHCASCRAALERAQAARDALRSHLADPAVDLHRPELWGAIRASLLESGKLRPVPATEALSSLSSTPKAAPKGRLLRLVPVAAAAAGLFFLGTLAGRGGPQPLGGESAVTESGALVQEQPLTVAAEVPQVAPGLTPLGDDSPSLRQEAWPWLGDVLPLTSPRPLGASAAGLSSAASYRSDGVR